MKKNLTICTFSVFSCLFVFAGPPNTTTFIKIDQFGYSCAAKKVAVISDPQIGYNASEQFNPGTGKQPI